MFTSLTIAHPRPQGVNCRSSPFSFSARYLNEFDCIAEKARSRISTATTLPGLRAAHTRASAYAEKNCPAGATIADLRTAATSYITEWARARKAGRLQDAINRVKDLVAAHAVQAGIEDPLVYVSFGNG